MPPAETVREFITCGYRWADTHVPDDLDAARLADLSGRVIEAASPSGAPLFAGWRALAVPDEPKALAVHRMNILRELRGGLHGACVLAAGLAPRDAVLVRSPYMAPIYGWEEPPSDVSALKDTWKAAEAATNRAIARAFEALSEGERAEFVELSAAAQAAAIAP
jgi:hypothetical protein